GIGWKQSSLTTLHNFVRVIHTTTNHAYYFYKYIFLNELQADPQCDLKEYINKEFFAEVWLSLVDYTKGNARAEKVIKYRNYISRYLPSYLNIT
ncbi:uncharacterized protein EV154DRAFT_392771, partial [Mucor mucedo]|uniref:uncharacterized protein n=1 Tax=Mucor mucedo TaxID=29922 RepID=UPI00221F72EB